MNKKEQEKLQRERQEDVVLNKVIWWVVGAVVLEFLMLLLNRYYVHYTPADIPLAQALRTVFRVLAVALPIGTAALAAWTVSLRRQGKKAGLAGGLTAAAAALSVCAIAVALFSGSGIQLLYTAIPTVAVLALIYYLYQRDFFVAAALCAMGLLGVHVIPRSDLSALVSYGYGVLAAVVLAAAVVLVRKLQTGDGALTVSGKTREIFSRSANYAMLYVTCGVVAAVLIAALVMGSVALLYGILVAWLLIMAVYYTVRLM